MKLNLSVNKIIDFNENENEEEELKNNDDDE